MMQGQRNIVSVAQLVMSELTPLVDAQHGAFYLMDSDARGEPVLQLIASYGFASRKGLSSSYRLKESLIGQSAFEKKRILLSDVPENFITIATGMGEAPPRSVLVLPVLFEGETKAVIELASFKPFVPNHLSFLDQLMVSLGVILNMISSSMRTEELLIQLKKSNAELEAQAAELNEKAKLLEVKNNEVELASRSLEEKAEQLQLISKYKSEFLANMSHELRTPLNSLLILSQVLAENRDGNLTESQVKFAQTVYTSGNELLALINEILDLSKVEAGKMPILPKAFRLDDIKAYLDQTFHHVADQKGLEFDIQMDEDLPETLFTDVNRLQQILKNLLSNAFKFTSRGGVKMRVSSEVCPDGETRVSFAVTDTGIGIPADKQKLIFEAFQQADGTTSRKYGGTGLGLTISREIDRRREHAGRGQHLHPARPGDVHGAGLERPPRRGLGGGRGSPGGLAAGARRGSLGRQGAARRRRHAQPVCDAHRARGARRARAARGERPGGDRAPRARARSRSRVHGHDDARDGRAYRDARDSGAPRPERAPDRVAHGEGHEGRSREGARGRGERLRHEAGRAGAAPLGHPSLAS
jgi:signal transduction histidine kinase